MHPLCKATCTCLYTVWFIQVYISFWRVWTFFLIYLPTEILDVLWILIPLRIWWSYETSFEKNRYMHKSQQSCISCQGFMNFLAATPGSPRVKNNLAPNLLPSRFHRYFFMLLNPWLWDVSMSESITPQLNRLSWFTLTLVPSKYFTLTEGKGREHNPCG